LAYRGRHSAICQETLPDVPQPADFGGFLYDLTWPSQRDVSTVAQTLRDLPTLTNGLEAVVQNLPDLENWFLHQWMRYCMDRRFVMGDF
jgi:hypothetical protein